MRKAVVGILAHVDAGKTTLAEALLYKSGRLRSPGRVDKGNTALDTHTLERERGITIFASQAVIRAGELEITLLDTPGHVDFSSETERTLSVLDYAVLVISGTDGVQAHTSTLWSLLRFYNVPVFVFVTKMDYARKSPAEIMAQLNSELSAECVDFSNSGDELTEKIALCDEAMLEKYLGGEAIADDDIASLIAARKIFPCFFGSGLDFTGVEEFLAALERFTVQKKYPTEFGASVFKISRDKEARLTHLKVTGGVLRVRDTLTVNKKNEKISGIRIYSGAKYETVDEAPAGTVCAVCGLASTEPGMGLGFEASAPQPVLEPVMNYRVCLPEGADPQVMLQKLRMLEEEEPELKVTWNSFLQEIHVGLMGEIQAEILKSLVLEKFNTAVTVDSGRVQYKETIENTVEGVGHYEPLRHYAEVHIIMEPLPTGSGIKIESKCSEDNLDRNWQRLILTHLQEREHLGVLTGSPLTDVKITLAAGRAHLKHTEGGDFRQATYRAVRHALMNTKSVLLEPWYTFRLEVPFEQIGRAINDIRMKSGVFDVPDEAGEFAVIAGRVPVAEMNGYASEVAAYTGGRGRLALAVAGYDVCHNAEKVIEEYGYDPERDVENTADSVFCAHGAGFNVKWDKVTEYMHLASCLKIEPPYSPAVNHRNLHIDDKELEAIMEREFGKVKYELFRPAVKEKPQVQEASSEPERKKWVIVDGYNVIFAWKALKELAAADLGGARERLMHIMCNYAAFTKNNVVLVFDAYKVPGNRGERFDFHNIRVVYTKERELGDVYIEKMVSEIGKNESVRVVSSDALIQLSAVRFGVLRESAAEFEREIDEVSEKISEFLGEMKNKNPQSTLGDAVKKEAEE